MKKWLTILWLAVCVSAFPATAAALKYKSAKGTETVITPRWQFEGDGLTPDQMNALVAELRSVELLFDVSPHLGRSVRIYLALPNTIKGLRGAAGFRVEWTTRGQLLNGSVVPGNRALVYEGKVSNRGITEVFDFSLHIDSRHFLGGLQFDPVFEVEEFSR